MGVSTVVYDDCRAQVEDHPVRMPVHRAKRAVRFDEGRAINLPLLYLRNLSHSYLMLFYCIAWSFFSISNSPNS